eukprot:CAMPEP_0171152988 /NCGR_PEP_ID=MMETSP0766_2-20121228/150840_1 /TAXON_ID=439317 /ORGANISM="Gambierdiscus australes, Strain CAWD 149" /LENGTH=166 /DNA_ID=CAMNT_0011616903 /DNA_START=581 /DNA_END=1082 /DNA_ORIENTATION=+
MRLTTVAVTVAVAVVVVVVVVVAQHQHEPNVHHEASVAVAVVVVVVVAMAQHQHEPNVHHEASGRNGKHDWGVYLLRLHEAADGLAEEHGSQPPDEHHGQHRPEDLGLLEAEENSTVASISASCSARSETTKPPTSASMWAASVMMASEFAMMPPTISTSMKKSAK